MLAFVKKLNHKGTKGTKVEGRISRVLCAFAAGLIPSALRPDPAKLAFSL
jgi:hypothetical protein